MILGKDANGNSRGIQVATKAGTSGAAAPAWNGNSGGPTIDGQVTWTNEQPHFIAYAGPVESGKTQYLWLTSQQCSDILSLDKFYAGKSQSSHPLAYRLISGGSALPANNPTTYTSTKTTVSTLGQNSSEQYASKVTSTEGNSMDVNIGASVALAALGISFTDKESSSTVTQRSQQVTTSYAATNAQTLQGQSQASTTVQDSSSVAVPVNVMQDSIFMGMAVQDTDMHYPVPPGFLLTTVGSRPPVAISGGTAGLPVIPAEQSAAMLRTNGAAPSAWLKQTWSGYLTVSKQSDPASMQAVRDNYAKAARKHTARTVPPPAAATTTTLTTGDAIQGTEPPEVAESCGARRHRQLE